MRRIAYRVFRSRLRSGGLLVAALLALGPGQAALPWAQDQPEPFQLAHVVRLADPRTVTIDRGFTEGVDVGLDLVAGDGGRRAPRLRVTTIRAHEADAQLVRGATLAPGDPVRPARPMAIVRGIITNVMDVPLINRGSRDGLKQRSVLLVVRGDILVGRACAVIVFADDGVAKVSGKSAEVRPHDNVVAVVPLKHVGAR